MERLLPGAKPGEVRSQLGRFGFSGEKANLAVRQLSGGERARLSLALITRDAPHILILDEPTNHLDVDAREALVEALTEFGGAVVVVSHDRHLLSLIADLLVLVDSGTAKELDGSLEDYRDMVLGASASCSERGVKSTASVDRKEARRLAAEAEDRAKAARKIAKEAEAELKSLLRRRDEIDAALSSPRSNGSSAGALIKSRAEVERQVAATEERWLEASNDAEASLAKRG